MNDDMPSNLFFLFFQKEPNIRAFDLTQAIGIKYDFSDSEILLYDLLELLVDH